MKKREGGFTLIELLVVIAIIAILAAILLPILVNAKRASLAVGCVGNLGQMGKAIQMYTQDTGGYLPVASDDLFLYAGDGGSGGGDYNEFRRGGKFSTPIWDSGLNLYIKDKRIWRCPADFGGRWNNLIWKPTMWSQIGGSYEYNVYINLNRRVSKYNPNGTNLLEQLRIDECGEQDKVPVIHDSRDTWHDLSSPRDFNIREARDGFWIVLFLDGHAKNIQAYELRRPGGGARWSDLMAAWWWRGGLRGSPRDPKTGR